MRRYLTVLIFILVSTAVFAQTTKVRGRVTDVATGEAVPFAGVFFKGTSIGTTTDLEGNYSLETRDSSATVLVCQILGYDEQEFNIEKGSFSTRDFKLKLSTNILREVVVKADNSKIKRLLNNIDAHKDVNDPERRPQYYVNVYNKMEMDLTNAKEHLKGRRFMREFGFVFDYLDTSVVSGVEYLPILISETVTDRYHTSSPELDREVMVANQISGVDPDFNLLSQFTGTLYLKANFYNDFINTFGVNFPSPIQKSGLLYYNYYIIDSLQVDSRKTYLVRYHPKPAISSPAFDGEMYIDAEDFALKSIRAKMVKGGNVNWLRDFVADVEYRRLEDSTWFYKSDKMYADFSVVLSDSSKLMSFLGNRDMEYGTPSFEPFPKLDAASSRVTKAAENVARDSAFWASARPYELSEKEKQIYSMVEAIKDQPLYRDLYTIIYSVLTGYLDIGPIGIGPYLKLVSFNNLEGFRPQIGIHTSKDFSRKFRISAYGAYGTRDKSLKGGLTYEQIFRRDLTRKLTLDGHYDVFQLGRGTGKSTDNNILSSFWHGAQKLSPMTSFSALYEHEVNPSVNLSAGVNIKRHFSNGFVPMISRDGTFIESVASNEAHLQARFSRDETVNRGHFVKTYIRSLYPVWTIDLTAAAPLSRKDAVSFVRPEISFDYLVKLPPVGMSKIHINAGTIIGTVPYPFLHIHPGNVTGFIDHSAFSCMDYLEFASDTWATIFYEHNFNGFFLGKIPLLKKLQLREIFTLKATYGRLSDKNNGMLNDGESVMMFPDGMKPLKEPYVEIGAGVGNILRLFRVDCFWRLTNREEARRPFVVNLGVEFKF